MSRKDKQQKKRENTAKQKRAAALIKYKANQQRGIDYIISCIKRDIATLDAVPFGEPFPTNLLVKREYTSDKR